MSGLSQPGEKHPMSKLTEDDVREIRERADQGETNVDIAADYPVHPDTISDIRQRKTWRGVEP